MLAPIQVKELDGDPGFIWSQYSPRVGSISNELVHFARVCYFQFSHWDEAHNFFKSITDKRLCGRAQVRVSERFTSGHEVKVWGMEQSTLDKLIERDHSRKPTSLPLPPIRRDWSMSESYEAHALEAA